MKLFQSPVHAAAGTQAEATARKGLLFLFAVRFIFALISPFSSRRLLMGIPARDRGGGWQGHAKWMRSSESLAVAFSSLALRGINPPGETVIVPSIKLIILHPHLFPARGSNVCHKSSFLIADATLRDRGSSAVAVPARKRQKLSSELRSLVPRFVRHRHSRRIRARSRECAI